MAHPALSMRSDLEDREAIRLRFNTIRAQTEKLASFLQPEDMMLQPMPEASPTRWHLAHVTWFFEEFVLGGVYDDYAPFDDNYRFLFNSYYEAVGERWARPDRGLLSRPTVAEILRYRQAVDERVVELIDTVAEEVWRAIAPALELGLNHEQQHQELICTDIKYAFGLNPLFPAAFPAERAARGPGPAVPACADVPGWRAYEGGLKEFGGGGGGFVFDNELPRYKHYLEDFELCRAPVTNGEYLEFVEDGAYDEPSLWLSDGWAWLAEHRVRAPLYWRRLDGAWYEYSLHGLMPLRADRFLSHISAYEAHAYAAWRGDRLPTEQELEIAALQETPARGQFLDPEGMVHPKCANVGHDMDAVFGSVWEWTSSSYAPYPGYGAPAGAVGEYNGKFMSSQLVLRGGSCATPVGHIRPTYRNFFPPNTRFQFSGVRLARAA